MSVEKKTLDRMARGDKRNDNTVFGNIGGKTEYHELGKYKVNFGYKGVKRGIELKDIISELFIEIYRLEEQNLKLHKMVKSLAKDLSDYKGKVGIE